MKKIILFSMMVLLLGACTSTKEANDTNKLSRGNMEEPWWEQAGDPDSEYWWINGYYDEDDSD